MAARAFTSGSKYDDDEAEKILEMLMSDGSELQDLSEEEDELSHILEKSTNSSYILDDEPSQNFNETANTVRIPDQEIAGVSEQQSQTSGQHSNPRGEPIELFWIKKPFKFEYQLPLVDNDHMNGEIRTPLNYFYKYYSEEFFQNTATCTEIYCLSKKNKELKTSAEEIKKLYGMHLLMGCIPYPRIKMYWQAGIELQPIIKCMRRDRFFLLKNCLHVVDICNPPENTANNKLWKVQPIVDAVRNACHSIERQPGNFSVDEQMVPFTGRCPYKQFVPNKPRPVGLKNFVLTTSDGIMLDFLLYQGSKTDLPDRQYGLGPSVVLKLKETIPPFSVIYFDRYFTTVALMAKLFEENFFATGTIMTNRLKRITFSPERDMNRGDFEELCSSNGKLVALKWKDSKFTTLLSSVYGSSPVGVVKRWNKKDATYINIQCPAIVTKYNHNMGGVDILNQLLECYRTWIKTKKWTLKVVLHFLDLAVVNCWLQYRRDCKNQRLHKSKISDLLTFRLNLSESLMCVPFTRKRPHDGDNDEVENPDRLHRPQNWRAPMPSVDKRLDGFNHWAIMDNLSTDRACRMKQCSSRTRVRCEKCNVYLCLTKDKNCFKNFHNEK